MCLVIAFLFPQFTDKVDEFLFYEKFEEELKNVSQEARRRSLQESLTRFE